MHKLAAMPDRRLFLALAGAAAATACASDGTSAPGPGPSPGPEPVQPPAPVQPRLVPVASRYPAIIDTATDTRPYLAALKALGVRSVFRYYATAAQPEVPQKQLTLAERDAILEAGLSIGSVWQYYSNVPANIHRERGQTDGETALARAATFAQPAGSAIYFGVDFDWLPSDGARRQAILDYFDAVKAQVQAAGYRVGVYGSGATCAAVLDAGLAELAWLVNSPGHTGAAAFYNSNRWRLFQNGLDVRVAGGIQIDTNIINPSQTDFGQWNLSGVQAAVAIPADATQLVLAGRRFVAKKSAQLRGEPDAAAAPIANTRFGKGRSVRVLALREDGWAQVDVNETGQATGWCRADDLTADMSRRPDFYAAD